MGFKHVAGACIALLFAFSAGLLLSSEPATCNHVVKDVPATELSALVRKLHLPVALNEPSEAGVVSPSASGDVAGAGRVLVADPSAGQLDSIFASLTRLHSKGELDVERLTWRVVDLLIGGKEPQMANELLVAVGSEQGGLFGMVGKALAEAGDEEGAYAAFVKALRLSPGSPSRLDGAFSTVLGRDPNLALQILETAAASPGFDTSRDFKERLARALIEVGRIYEAQQVVDGLVEEDPRDLGLMGLLERTNVDAAELRYRELVLDDPERWSDSLAELLFDAGRLAEGLEVLDERLREDPGNLDAIGTLVDYMPGEAERRLLSAYPDLVTDDYVSMAFDELGDAFQRNGDPGSAVRAWGEAVRRCPLYGNGTVAWFADFEDSAPDELLDAVESRLDSSSTADFYGELAGIAWRAGRRERAVALWQEALERFPEWDEWQANLDAAEAGRTPPELW